MTDDTSEDYEVGYKKPPKHSQFKPGESPNPGGRPKGKRSVHKVIQALCGEMVTVTENGKKKKMSKLELAAASLFGKASKGDVQAIRLLLSLKSEADLLADVGAEGKLTPDEQAALMREIDWLAYAQKAHEEVEIDADE